MHFTYQHFEQANGGTCKNSNGSPFKTAKNITWLLKLNCGAQGNWNNKVKVWPCSCPCVCVNCNGLGKSHHCCSSASFISLYFSFCSNVTNSVAHGIFFWDLSASTAFAAMMVQCTPINFRLFSCNNFECHLWILLSAAACWKFCCQPAESVIHRVRKMVEVTRAVILWGLLEHFTCANLGFCSLCLDFCFTLGRCGAAVLYRQHEAGDNCKLFNGAVHREYKEVRWE